MSIALLVVAAVSVVLARRGQQPAVFGAAIAALLVAAAGIAILFSRRLSDGPDRVVLAVLVVIGLAGAALGGLLPDTAGFVIVYLSLAGLGMNLPPGRALAAAVVVLAALNLSYLLTGPLSVAAQVSQDIGAAFVFAVGAFIRSSRIAQEQARVAQARAEDLLAQLRASQEAQAQAAALTERTRLAREIHDVLAHTLTGLVLALDTLELLGRQGDAGSATMDRMLDQVTRGQRIARAGLADTKRAIAALRGDELPGPALLDQLVRDITAAGGIRAELTVIGSERPLSPEIGLTLYRTAQEALTNTVKYAGRGASVQVRLRYDDGTVELAIDDVRAQDGAAQPAGLTFGGYGLTGMRERAELLGGSLTARPTGRGFEVRLGLPAELAVSPTGPADGLRS